MKRLSTIILSLILILGLCACTPQKSEAAQNADTVILNIGTVTLDSKEKIDAAENAVSALSDADLEQLENLSVLEDAKNEYLSLQAQEVEEKIDAIKAGDRKNASLIKRARGKYNSSSPEVQKMVKNYDKLVQFEEDLCNLKVQEAIDAINNIGTLTYDNRHLYHDAKRKYDELRNEEKSLVTNYSILEKAEKEYSKIIDQLVEESIEEENVQLNEILATLREEYDAVEDLTWYFPSTFPEYADTRSYMLPYIAKLDYTAFLKLRFLYTGDDWVFFDRVIISVDEETYRKSFDYFDIHRGNDTEVWEYIDINPTPEDMRILNDIVNSETTIVRFQGDEHKYDLTIDSDDKAAIGEVINAYNALVN